MSGPREPQDPVRWPVPCAQCHEHRAIAAHWPDGGVCGYCYQQAKRTRVLLVFAHDQLWEILVGMALFGIGTGATYAAMPSLIARRVAAQELGSAVSFNQVLRTRVARSVAPSQARSWRCTSPPIGNPLEPE